MSWWDDVKGFGKDVLKYGTGYKFVEPHLKDERGSEYADIDPSGRLNLFEHETSDFRNRGAGRFHKIQNRMGETEDMMRRRAMGENSLVGEQLRQNMERQRSQMMSAAAGAAPGNSAMAARNAMMAAGRAGTAMSGQAAAARIAEQNAAMDQLGKFQAMQGQQNLEAFGKGGQLGLGALQTGVNAGTSRYAADMGVPSRGERVIGALGGGLQAVAKAKSDKRAKEDIRPASGDMRETMRQAFLQGQRDGLMAARRDVNLQQDRDRLMQNRAKVIAERHAYGQGLPLASIRAWQESGGFKAKAGDKKAAGEMMAKLNPVNFKYKDPSRHGEGKRVGVNAQDLEKSKLGKRMVYASGDGMKGVQMDAGAVMAALANLDDRQRKLEGKKDK